MNLRLAFLFAWRELRGGTRGLRIVIACLALGVAVIAAVGSLREGIDRGLEADGQTLLGGDLVIETSGQPLPPEARHWLEQRGNRLSAITLMRSMAVAPSGERQLVELKAVDGAWPLLGAPVLRPPVPLADALAVRDGRWGVLLQPAVADRLGLKPGDPVRIGSAIFTFRAVLEDEPDRVTGATAALAPRAVVPMAAMAATGLLAPGAIIENATRAAGPPGRDVGQEIAALQAAFPDGGWRIRDFRNAAPGMTRFLDQTALFMTLVGLTSLLVGGIGAANGVRAWLEARARTIATLRALGASAGLVFAVCFIQVMALALLGTAIGLILGAALPALGGILLRALLPVVPQAGLYPGPLALAAVFGLLTAAAFTLWPLGRAARIPGAALFRDAVLPDGARPPPAIIAANAAIVLALIALTIAVAPDRRFAAWFCAAAALTLLLFRVGAVALAAAARHAARLRSPAWRLGLGNLGRPGAPTASMLVSVGLGLATLATVVLIQGNVRRELAQEIPANAPTFFFIDVQNEQVPALAAIVAGQPGASDLHEVPSLRARVVAIKGVPVEQAVVTPETRFALRGDRGLTYAAAPPAGTKLVAGAWWPADYRGKPLVSFDAGLAAGWGVGVGDVIRVNVLGRDIDLTVASLREINWRSLSINFFMVASPGILEQAPHTHIATVRVPDPAAQGALLRAVTDAMPNVTGILVADVLKAFAALLDKIAAALAATGSLTLAAGGLVLAGALAAGQRRRTRDAVILKSLGATRAQIRAAWLVEFGVLGAVAGAIAALVGGAASWGVMHFLMNAPWSPLPSLLLGTISVCVGLMLAAGYAGTEAALRAKAAPLLRTD